MICAAGNEGVYYPAVYAGRAFLTANVEKYDRSKLVLYISQKDKLKFTGQIILTDCAWLWDVV